MCTLAKATAPEVRNPNVCCKLDNEYLKLMPSQSAKLYGGVGLTYLRVLLEVKTQRLHL